MRPTHGPKLSTMEELWLQGEADAPTAAWRRLQATIRKVTNSTLTPQAAILATFPTEPSCPNRGIPHVGLIPTGAEAEGVERFVRVPGDER